MAPANVTAAATGAECETGMQARLAACIRDVPDFPQPGVMFKDITPLLGDARAFADCIATLAAPWRHTSIEAVCGIEARGFIFGAALARELDTAFVPLRKPGKLPAATFAVEFQLEYGEAQLEVHADALANGASVLLVDDVLATGGTLAAAAQLLGKLGARVAGATAVVELDFLHGRARWPAQLPLHTLLHFD